MISRQPMILGQRSKVKVRVRLQLGDRVAGVSHALLSSALLVIIIIITR